MTQHRMIDDDVEVADEDNWEETPGGYAKIAIDLDDDVVKQLVDIWVENNLQAPSQEIYFEGIQDGVDRATVLHQAVINDTIIKALTRKIEETEADAESEDV